MEWLVWIFYIVLAVLMLGSWWRIFAKAGIPGWQGLVPILNLYRLAEIAGKPGWWGLLGLVPCIGIVFMIMIEVDLAKRFGKGTGFALGLILLGIVFFPILAFGSAQYRRPGQTA